MSERMTVEEIYAIVDSGNHLTFDYLVMCFVASFISAAGLVSDSSTIGFANDGFYELNCCLDTVSSGRLHACQPDHGTDSGHLLRP